MKCEICKKQIAETFLKKLVGTYIYDAKHKKRNVCFECQSHFKNDKAKMLETM
ncbi:hypothetical protein HY636_03640 [Candidatus Woesearchaeota archaeon]|nr:hypothetical protein [Candidatus Woesearchaeota archaeon]